MPDYDDKSSIKEIDDKAPVLPEPNQSLKSDSGPGSIIKPVVEQESKPNPTPEPVPSPAPVHQVVSTSSSASYFDLLRAVVVDPELTGDQKQMMLKELKSSSPTSDRLTYRLAISLIGIIAMLAIVVIWHLLARTTPASVPDGLIAIASGAVGGLAGLLSPSRSGDSNG